MFNLLKGGKRKMPRNLVKEREEKEKEEIKAPTPQEDTPVQVITENALILNRLQVLENLMREGFNQVGVKFPDE
jgi:predicted nucleic acid-binding OB-fold protein